MTTTTATRCISNPTAMETFKAKGFNYKNYNINRLQSHDFIGVYYVGGFLNRKLSHSILHTHGYQPSQVEATEMS